MPCLTHCRKSALGALLALLCAGFQAGPAFSEQGVRGDGSTLVLAAAATPETAPPRPDRSQEDRVETRIKDLHSKLKITGVQEAQWNAFAEVMRDNAQAVDTVLKERSENLHTMNAVDDLRSYQKLADAHADGLRRLVPAFEALYNLMSEDQKKTADVVFAEHEKRPPHAGRK
jgi:hypothetical protein